MSADRDARIAQLEQQLQESRAGEHLLRSLLANTFQFIGCTALDGTLELANASALALINATADQVLGRHFADTPWWSHAPDQQQRLRAALEAARGGEPQRFEATHVGADGLLHTVDFSVLPMRQDGVITRLVVEGRDITELKQAQAALEASRSMLRVVLDAVPIRVFWKDKEGRYLGCNEPFAKDAGARSVADLLGKTDFDCAWRQQAELYRRDDQLVMRSGQAITNYEEPQTNPDGEQLWLSTSKLPLRGPDGEVMGVLGLYEDITARKAEEHRRLAMEASMQQAQKLESLGLLASSIAHDFNNLLTVIVSNVELLRMGARDAELLESIDTASLRAAELCRQLLTYSGRRSTVGAFDVNAVVQEMSALLRVSIKKKAALVLDLAPQLPPVHGDASKLRQVLLNLITNASDAIGENEGTITVRTTRLGPQRVGVEVRDSGSGMDAATLARIFEPFFTTKTTGRGLGLAMVKGIVEAHGGTLEVSSTLHVGTTFTLSLPTSDEVVVPVRSAAPERWSGLGRVLVVDDEAPLLDAAARLVTQFGFEVVTARDGREALDRYEVGKFALVLLDFTMPRFDGVETTRALRARDPRAKIVLTSGYHIDDLFSQGDTSRPDAFLEKPFSIAGLTEVLRGLKGPSGEPLLRRVPAA